MLFGSYEFVSLIGSFRTWLGRLGLVESTRLSRIFHLRSRMGGAQRGTHGVLALYIRNASGLKAADLNGLSDPYVKVRCLGTEQRTHVIHKTLNPQWGVRLEFMPVMFDKLVAEGVQLEVFDHDKFNRDDPLGSVTVDLSALEGVASVNFDAKLPTQGTITFSATWTEMAPRLRHQGVLSVKVQRADGLKAADSNGLSDPYVKLLLGKEKHKTKTIKKTLSPTWDETFTWKGVLYELAQQSLKLEVFDHDTWSRDDPLGSANVSLRALEVVDVKRIHAKLSTQGFVHLRVTWTADTDKHAAKGSGADSARKSADFDSSEQVVCSGTLHMRLGALSGWKMRFVELSEELINYYASRTDKQRIGLLPLECITMIRLSTSDARRFSVRVDASLGASSQGRERSVTRRTIEFAALDETARDRWVRTLSLLCGPGVMAGSAGQATRSASGASSARTSSRTSSEDLDEGSAVARYYGVPLADVSMMEEGGSGLRVPAVLLCLWDELVARPEAEGLGSEGIFRLSADQSEVSGVKQALEQGQGTAAVTGASSQCVAALIKLYLRSLPDDLWSGVRPQLEALASGGGEQPPVLEQQAKAQAVIDQMPRLCADLVIWVCNVMATVVAKEGSNRMGIEAAATVFAPGLVPPPPGDDLSALMLWTDKGVEVTALLARAHMAKPLRPDSADGTDLTGPGADGPEVVAGEAQAEAEASGVEPKRRARLSMDEKMQGLNALLAEMEVGKITAVDVC